MHTFRSLLKSDGGNAAIIFSLAIVPLLLAVGAGIDMVRANWARTVLQAAADAAVLAEGSSEKAVAVDLKNIADSYILANGADSAVRSLEVADALADADGGVFQIHLTGKINTSFMALAGIGTLDVEAYSEARRGSTGPLELVLALDTTYSMSADDKIGTLKTAAKALVNSVMVAGKTKVGVVPFADYLNISMNYIGAPWLNVPADQSGDYESCDWSYPDRTQCTVQTTCYADGVPYSCNQEICADWGTPVKTSCTAVHYTCTFEGCIKSRPEPYLDSVADPTDPAYEGTLGNVCGAPILEMTTNKTDVIDRIDDLSPTGNTYIPSGLVWAWNMLTPEEPLTAAEPMAVIHGKGGKKAVVLMTDGANTVAPRKSDQIYSNFDDAGYGNDSTEIDGITASLCEKMKAEGMVVYTVLFDVTDAKIESLLRGCASETSNSFVANDAAELLAAFKAIGTQLTQLHLTR